jgi:uncharacterized membrane protein
MTPPTTTEAASARGVRAAVTAAALQVILALAGLAIAAYLTVVRLAGGLPACGPSHGCETVAQSVYSVAFGVPVATWGLAFSILLSVLAVAWWRLGDRRALFGTYALGLVGILTVAYLTYLELFVIRDICIWCVSYAVTIVLGWLIAAREVRRTG